MQNKISPFCLLELMHTKNKKDILVYSLDIKNTISGLKENGIEINRYFPFINALGISLKRTEITKVLSQKALTT